jgi:hypothetical protein
MDVPEADFDIKLQKISGDLISEIDKLLPNLFHKHDSSGALKVRPRVRAREVDRLTGSVCRFPRYSALFSTSILPKTYAGR